MIKLDNENIIVGSANISTTPLKPFDSGLTYVEQPEETSIVIEWLKLDLDNPDNLDDLNINSTEYPDLECSIYIGSAHNICTVRMLRIVRVEKDRFKNIRQNFSKLLQLDRLSGSIDKLGSNQLIWSISVEIDPIESAERR